MKLRCRFKTSFIAALILIPTLSHATSLYVRPFSEFTQTAPNMVHGVIRNLHTENGTTEDGGKTIYTYADFDVKEVIKGKVQHQGEILIRKLGGTKDGLTLDIPSSVDFSENEEAVLFLSEVREDRSYEVVGMEMGKFGVKEENGELILTNGIFALSRTDQDVDLHNTTSGDLKENLRPWSLNQLRELIKKQTQGNPTPSPTPTPVPTVKPIAANAPSENNAIPSASIPANSNEPEPTNEGYQKFVALGLILAGLAGLFFYLRRR